MSRLCRGGKGNRGEKGAGDFELNSKLTSSASNLLLSFIASLDSRTRDLNSQINHSSELLHLQSLSNHQTHFKRSASILNYSSSSNLSRSGTLFTSFLSSHASFLSIIFISIIHLSILSFNHVFVNFLIV